MFVGSGEFTVCIIRNKFHHSDIHRSTNAVGRMHVNCRWLIAFIFHWSQNNIIHVLYIYIIATSKNILLGHVNCV